MPCWLHEEVALRLYQICCRHQKAHFILNTDAVEEEQIQEMRETARKELEDWYKHRDEQLEKTKATNRSVVEG